MLRTVDKIENPHNYPSRNLLSTNILFSQTNRFRQLISFTTQHLGSKMKTLRNMSGTKPASHENYLEEAQSLEERPSRQCVGSKMPWIISTIISTCLALFLFVIRTNPNCPFSSPVEDTFETGFSTDLGMQTKKDVLD